MALLLRNLGYTVDTPHIHGRMTIKIEGKKHISLLYICGIQRILKKRSILFDEKNSPLF